MTAKNKPISKPQSKEYDAGYDRIFKKKDQDITCEFIRVRGTEWRCQTCGKADPNDCPRR